MSDDLVKQLQNPRPMSMFLTRADQVKDWTELLHTAADRIEELEAKLAKAVEAMQFWSEAVEPDIDKAIALMDATLAELTGGSND